ncbi:Rieske 2Fe-2S domain-containing protein [Zhongshania sp.]|jgi:3-ketosteroid 9alpha-monooxygenase subunit A|uniref:Rieske 2Fe-2S domain-containing protein n=1 Tax=Zhongshania sp. TaxID=1971902 RepID=UPI001B609EB9|nr:Rieske 2Fe-2S domain-containing protein [Zhongshania sp.]MBQ0795379.1 Rieske 2Fe-2S domain-containing protein [Zhongshania sp.]
MSQVAQVPRQPHIIEAAELPDRYARGWYCLGLASEYTSTPVKLNYFGTRLVAYRGDDGEIHILDGYCPHMGADLSEGCVEGSSIRCPFHAWRWGADGVCDDIPYAKRIPAKAVIRSYPTLEENHLLFMWFDPEGNPPIEEQRPPRIDDVFSDDWTIWQMDLMTINTNARELIDNMADVAHFGPIHGAPITEFKNIVYKHTYRQELTGGSELLAEDGALSSEATYYGPAYMNTYMTGQAGGVDIASRLLVTHVPINHNGFDLRFGVAVKKIAGMSEQQNEEMAREYVQQNRTAFFQDVHIWHTKTRVDNPVLCDGDGPITRLRQWYNQFYVDVAEVPQAFNEKREYVVDYALRNT